MTPTIRTRHGFTSLLSLLIFLGLLLCFARASDPLPSSASSDLICHTSNPDECYPRVFQPADEFQTVHDDQELPNGLHVRMNIWTGKKEAKINVPGDEDPSLEGLPVDQAVVVVDPEQVEEEEWIPKGAPKYDPVGKIKEPAQEEAATFHGAFDMLKAGQVKDEQAFDAALDVLEELSHDIYYGLQIAEDTDVVKALLCQMGRDDPRSVAAPRDQQAAAILAGALSNNPSALKQVAQAWDDIMGSKCDGNTVREGFYSSLVSPPSPSKAKAKVAAINGLLKDESIRRDFLKNHGMRWLLEVLVFEGEQWTAAQRRVGQLVLDTFLDEDMGAVQGQWPTAARLVDDECRSAESATDEGCWDYHVERITNANKRSGGHWSKDLRDRLAEARTTLRHDEL